LGAKPSFAGFVDGEADVNPATYASFQRLVESESPSVILAHWPVDNHPDHRAASVLTYEAWRHRKDRCSLFYYEVTDGSDTTMFAPNEFVDIGSVEGTKKKACFAHASQSPDRFYAVQTEVSRFRGIESGYPLAEAFMRHPESPAHAFPL
jgi:N-acetylglucosamine malate deacetylase 1